MEIVWTRQELTTARPFGIARWTHQSYPRVRVSVRDGDVTGHGEATPNAYYGETIDTVLAVLPALAEALPDDPWAWHEAAAAMEARFPHHHRSAQAALEAALLDLLGQFLGVPVAALLSGAMGEIVAPQAGALAVHHTAQELAVSIRHARRKDRGRVRAWACRFSAETMVEGYVDLLEQAAEDARDLAAALEIQSIPTIMGFRKGNLVFRQAGLLSGKQLDSLIEQIKELDIDALVEEAKKN